MNNKTIYLLIGKKGSGKSFISSLLESEFAVTFIRVEDWALLVKENFDIERNDYHVKVFEAIETGLRKALETHDRIVFESLGLSEPFNRMFCSLKKDFKVIIIAVTASSKLCLDRVRSRDGSIHVNISDEQVTRINKMVDFRKLQTDFVIINEGKSKFDLIQELKSLINK